MFPGNDKAIVVAVKTRFYKFFWLFGGYSAGGYLGDLWKFDGAQWTWVSGSSTTNQVGVYGTQGVADEANRPGARRGSVGWTDGEGDLWLFGGNGYASAGGYLNDLWKFDGTCWTWISGDSTAGQTGEYGTKGVADAANKPEARWGVVGLVDGAIISGSLAVTDMMAPGDISTACG